MIKKKLFVVIMCILACLTVVSACSSTTKEETTKSSEKKSKKKAKKDKDKDKSRKETTEEDIESKEEDLANNLKKAGNEGSSIDEATREELKAQTIETLDSLLSSDSIVMMWEGIGNGMDGKVTLARYIDGDKKIYYLIGNEDDPSRRIYTLTDTQKAYVSYDSNHWSPSDEKERLNGSTLVTSSYVSYLSIIYAALDEGFDVTYLPDSGMYSFETDREKIKDVDIHSISAKLNNKAQYDEFETEFLINDESLKTFLFGIDKKSYGFYYLDGSFAVAEKLYDKDGNNFESSLNMAFLTGSPEGRQEVIDMLHAMEEHYN